MAALNKNKDPGRWLLRNNQNVNEETIRMFKQEPDAGGSGVDAGRSLGPNGRRLRVKQEAMEDLFGDDEGGGSRRRTDGMDVDFDEVPYEEEFADDEEKVGLYEDDELTKEMEVRALTFLCLIQLTLS
jgi:transcription initiation factor TFIIF subunit alpha